MPSSRKAHNALLARSKALHTHVYISGLKGHHTLEVGLAYYYRGHYIYAYPAGNLIESIPYSTRKGIMIQGIVSASAPVWDAEKKGLVEEGSVSALSASIQSEKEVMEQSAADKVAETSSTLKSDTSSPAPPAPFAGRAGTEGLRPPLSSLALLRESALTTFTPHSGAHFLSASAPGSRLASRAASPSGLRPISSHAGLARLGAIKGASHHLNNLEHEANSSTEDVPSRPSSIGYLFGLGDHALPAKDLSRCAEVEGGVRVAPCAIHGEECDGVTTTKWWLTEESRRGMGFVEEVPMVEGGGRVMIDWARLLA